MENKINGGMVVGIVVVVAIIASLVTLQFTGNAIVARTSADKTTCINSCYAENCASLNTTTLRTACKTKCSNSCTNVEIYTKAEVDGKLNSLDAKIIALETKVNSFHPANVSSNYRAAKWMCYNGESQSQGGDTSCKSSEVWQSYADRFCENKCSNSTNITLAKCGVSSFAVSINC